MRSSDLVETVREYIRSEGLGPGDRLPPERELVRVLGGSRGTMRRALDALKSEGLLWRGVGRGTFLGPPPPERSPPLRWDAGPAAGLQTTNPAEVLEARSVLEPRMTAIAALRATPEDLARLDRSLRECATARVLADFEVADSAFHCAVADACHNAMLMSLFQALNEARQGDLWGRLKQASLTRERMSRYVRQHQAIRDAIADRDRMAAESAMRDHLREVTANMLGEGAA
ncbi:FadR/GntR family transcriptional regulator [Sediminicurvatus halobius]|uniref:FadR family transcriptional regulator n=1 Tax=Sediminicurvatus halobius TaxID=2182432 RepID=A0A2U2N9E2_9GAMM|nr:FadR/GntR family transcriptional regulator [Spiribacter halobius]PWG65801.1 FadR family transcriptional regulator [Spiribacter halobius]UEX77843.1 FadR family transcriptional regulator [Spiribacter halobius]